jgi:hypothetical protein
VAQQQQLQQQQMLQQQQQQQLRQQQLQQQQQQLQQQQQQEQARQASAADSALLSHATGDATKARAELKKAQIELAAVARRFDKSIDSKPDVQAASQEFKLAQDALQTATAKATESLKSNAGYQRAVTEAKEAHAQVDSLRANSSASPDQRFAAATASMAANKSVSAFESAALTANPQVMEARTKLKASADALHKLRDSYATTAMHEDAGWQAASKDLEQKQKDVAAADVKVADVRKAITDRMTGRATALGAPNNAVSPNGQSAINPTTQPAK